MNFKKVSIQKECNATQSGSTAQANEYYHVFKEDHTELKKTVAFLKEYNEWRRGKEVNFFENTSATEVGIHLDIAIKELDKLCQ